MILTCVPAPDSAEAVQLAEARQLLGIEVLELAATQIERARAAEQENEQLTQDQPGLDELHVYSRDQQLEILHAQFDRLVKRYDFIVSELEAAEAAHDPYRIGIWERAFAGIKAELAEVERKRRALYLTADQDGEDDVALSASAPRRCTWPGHPRDCVVADLGGSRQYHYSQSDADAEAAGGVPASPPVYGRPDVYGRPGAVWHQTWGDMLRAQRAPQPSAVKQVSGREERQPRTRAARLRQAKMQAARDRRAYRASRWHRRSRLREHEHDAIAVRRGSRRHAGIAKRLRDFQRRGRAGRHVR